MAKSLNSMSVQLFAYFLYKFVFNCIFSFSLDYDIFIMFYQGNSKWASYQDGEYSFLENDYAHQSILNLSVKYSKPSAKIHIQQEIHQVQGKRMQTHTTGDIRVQLPLDKTDRSLYSRISSSGKFGLYYDHGLLQFKNGQGVHFYSGFQTDRSFSRNVYKIGASLVGKEFHYGLRFRYESRLNSLLVHMRGINQGQHNNHNWRANFYTLLDPRINKIIKNGLLFGLNHENKRDSLYLRIQSGKRKVEGLHWCELFQECKLNWTRQLSQTTKIGAQSSVDLGSWQNFLKTVSVGGSWRFPVEGITLRAKVDNQLTSALTITHELVGYGCYSLGVEIGRLGRKNVFKFGTGISLQF